MRRRLSPLLPCLLLLLGVANVDGALVGGASLDAADFAAIIAAAG